MGVHPVVVVGEYQGSRHTLAEKLGSVSARSIASSKRWISLELPTIVFIFIQYRI
jgi:hypothetical protein